MSRLRVVFAAAVLAVAAMAPAARSVAGGQTSASSSPQQLALRQADAGSLAPASAGGWGVERIYPSDPDMPGEVAPLVQPGVGVSVGDAIISVDGVPTLAVADPGVLLRGSAGKQVLLRVLEASARASGRSSAAAGRPAATSSATAERSGEGGGSSAPAFERDVVVTPISLARERDLRYDAWEYTRRLAVDSMSGGRIGYVHLRAMDGGNRAEWVREYYPVANRDGRSAGRSSCS